MPIYNPTGGSGGSGIASVNASTLAATGAVNGSNKAFTFTSKPNFICSDGAWYQQTDANGVTQWTWTAGTLTATMTIPPTSVIFGIL